MSAKSSGRARRRRTVPLSIRLVATYATLTAATLLVVAGIVVLLVRGHLARELDHELEETVHSFRNGPATHMASPSDLPALSREWLRVKPFHGDQVVAVRTADGAVLSTSSELDLRQLADGSALLGADESKWWDVPGPNGPVRALTTPILWEGRQIGTIVVAASEEQIRSELSALLAGVGLASVVGMALAAGLGFGAVRRTLRPLRRIAEEVRTVENSGYPSWRVTQDGPMDEVGSLAAAFNRMLEKLQATFDNQRRFLADASHELRTPLTVARGQLELLDGVLSNPEHRRSLGLAVEELDRMRRIVEDLLLLARLDEGVPMSRESVEVELVLREAALRAMLLAGRDIAVHCDPDLFALADPEGLLRVVTNLVTNAVQHTSQDAAVSLAARRRADRLVIEVCDSGPGISPHDLPHVFDRMYRGSDSRSSSPGGAGLGLPIATSLIQAMEGTIHLESGPRGTTFTIDLPSVEPAHGPQASSERAEPAGGARGRSRDGGGPNGRATIQTALGRPDSAGIDTHGNAGRRRSRRATGAG